MTVADFEPTVTHASVNACLSDSVVVLQGYPAGGTYEGAAVTGNVLQLSSNIPEYQLSYTYVDDNGCSSTVPFLVSVSHNIYEMDTAVCSSDLPFQWRGQSITTSGTYQSIQSLETTCDSLYILHFSVIQQPQLLVSEDFIVEQGESLTLQASGAVTYLWSPAGSLSSSSVANPTATPTQSTQYVVRGFNTENCFSVDSVKVLIKQHVDTTICDDDLPLVWYGCTFADTVSVYSVTSLVDECRMTAHFLVEGCDLQLVLPNAITPSKGDGLNDGFGIPETLQPFLGKPYVLKGGVTVL